MKSFLTATRCITAATLLSVSAYSFASTPSDTAAARQQFGSENDKVSYALGVEMGEAFKMQSIEIKPELLAQGVEDAMQDKPFLLNDEDLNNTLIEFRNAQLAAQTAQIAALAGENKKVGDSFLDKNKAKSDITTTDSGLQYKVLQAGEGSSPSKQSRVEVNYEGRFIDGQVFDSSYTRGQTAAFKLTEVIPGWTEALQLMNKGAVWEVYVPSHLAYGEQGIPGMIGPNETLVFKIELIDFK